MSLEDEEWKEKCDAMKELKLFVQDYQQEIQKKATKKMLLASISSDSTNYTSSSEVGGGTLQKYEQLFCPDSIQTLMLPFRSVVSKKIKLYFYHTY
jgi:hypothetical protein